ncbi:MAG: Ppx/GppA family phosphatase, partial [Chloroflexota bacterium]
MTVEPAVAAEQQALSAIVPRWEWRTFGGSFGGAEDRLASEPTDRLQESDETYLLSLESDASVKVRDGLMDVKELQHVEVGLEQWRPVLKASFPVDAAVVVSLLTALGVEVPPLARTSYTFDELVRDLVDPNPSLRAVDVHKHREHYLPNGCMAEVTTLTAGSHSTRTIAVESTDRDLVTATVGELGLGTRPNVCLARGLKTLVGFEAVRYAVIDVGTNSVKFHVGEHRPDGSWRTIVDRAEVTQLGEGLAETGSLGRTAIARTVDAVAAMAEEARRSGAAAIAAVGTAGLRIAPNAAELLDAVRERCGVGIEVISGEEEARLAYRAATAELDVGDGTLAVFDTGGGSSQFSFGRRNRVDERFSVDVGAVRLTEGYGLDGIVSAVRLEEARATVAHGLARLDGRRTPDAVIGIGGAVTNLAAVRHGLLVYDPDAVQGAVLTRADVEEQIERYRRATAAERGAIVGLQPARAEVIL